MCIPSNTVAETFGSASCPTPSQPPSQCRDKRSKRAAQYRTGKNDANGQLVLAQPVDLSEAVVSHASTTKYSILHYRAWKMDDVKNVRQNGGLLVRQLTNIHNAPASGMQVVGNRKGMMEPGATRTSTPIAQRPTLSQGVLCGWRILNTVVLEAMEFLAREEVKREGDDKEPLKRHFRALNCLSLFSCAITVV